MEKGPYPLLKIALSCPRDLLYKRIEKRFDEMIEKGFLQEVNELWQRGYARNLPAMKAVGYRQLFSYLDGDCSLEESIVKAKQESRHYAKRQMTWLRREQNLLWTTMEEAEPVCANFLIREFL